MPASSTGTAAAKGAAQKGKMSIGTSVGSTRPATEGPEGMREMRSYQVHPSAQAATDMRSGSAGDTGGGRSAVTAVKATGYKADA